jgi:hypothetical protein
LSPKFCWTLEGGALSTQGSLGWQAKLSHIRLVLDHVSRDLIFKCPPVHTSPSSSNDTSL